MRFSFQPLPRSVAAACLFASAFAGLPPAHAQDFAPTYSRHRTHAHDFGRRGDGHGFSGHRGGGYNNSYYDPSFYSSVVAGSYYQRPYPYHFDYYRRRWGGPPANYGPDQLHATPDCPCAADSYDAPLSYPQPVPAPSEEAAATPAASDPA